MFTDVSNEHSTLIANSCRGSSVNKAPADTTAGGGFETYRFLKFIVGSFLFYSVIMTEGIFLDSIVRSGSNFTYNWRGGGGRPVVHAIGLRGPRKVSPAAPCHFPEDFPLKLNAFQSILQA